MTRVAVISANLGAYDQPVEWPALLAPPGVEVSICRLTDATYAPRPLAMTSRLQCGIPKWFGWQFIAGDSDAILWIDASCAPTAGAVPWFLEQLGSAEVAAFAHPDRHTVREEYAFIRARMRRPGERYLTSRYQGEWLEDEFDAIRMAGKADLPLYATTAFIYRPTARVQAAFAECFLWKARYCLHDQLAFPYVLDRHQVSVSVIYENYLKCAALTYVRNRKKAA